MAFHEVRFPTDVSFGATGGPEWRVDVVELASGREVRNAPWSGSRRRYDVGVGLRSLADLEEVLAFFEARRGPLHGFRMRDWVDWKSCSVSEEPTAFDQVIGTGDGVATEFVLRKTYRSGDVELQREVSKPVDGTLRVALGDGEVLSGWSVDVNTGVLSFEEPPMEGVSVQSGFEFDVPVRFESGSIVTSLSKFSAGEVPSIPLIEVRV